MQGAANMIQSGITSLSSPVFPSVPQQAAGIAATPASSALPGAPVITPQTLSSTQRDQELARLRRQKELEELQRQVELQRQQQSQASLLAQQHQQLLEAEQAEERAHQERLRQLRASLAPPPVALPQSIPATPPMFSPLASHTPATSFIPVPTHSHLGPTSSAGLSPHSPLLGGSPAPNPMFGASSPISISTEQIQAMIDQRVQALTNPAGSAAAHCHSHGTSSVCADHGTNKLKTNKVVNNDMAARFGVFAQPLFEVDGDIESGDISKMRKVLKPGRDDVGSGMVLRQAAWPHKLLQRTVPGYNEVSHNDLTFHQLMNGLISKITSETPGTRLDHELANKLSFVQFLVSMSFSYEHKAVLDTYDAIHTAWEMKTFEWSDSWDSINDKLKNIRAQHTYALQPVTYKKSFKCSSCTNKSGHSSSGVGGGGAQSGRQQQAAANWINGVPTSFMQAQNICIKFNKERGCPEKAAHKKSSDPNVTLLHVCAGCFKKENKQDAHRVFDCQKGPFKALFRGW